MENKSTIEHIQTLEAEVKSLESYIKHQKFTKEEFDDMVKDILGCFVINPVDMKGEVENILECHIDRVYCKSCGSCGETGCCSPSRCESVRCLYGESNIVAYEELLNENEVLRNQNKKMLDLLDVVTQEGSIRKGESPTKRVWPLHSKTYIAIMHLLQDMKVLDEEFNKL